MLTMLIFYIHIVLHMIILFHELLRVFAGNSPLTHFRIVQNSLNDLNAAFINIVK